MSSRSTLARRVFGLVAAPALLVGLAACGDDDDDSASSADFCDSAREIDEGFAEIDDPTEADFGDIADTMGSIEPPAEIAEDWDTMVDGFDRLQDVDFSDPESFDEEEFAEADEASGRVVEYLDEECGIGG